MKRILCVTSILILALTHPDASQGQIELGLHGGYNLDAFTEDGVEEGAFMIGGEARLGLTGMPVVFAPSVNYFMNGIENSTVLQFNADALFQFGSQNVAFTPYVGVGVGITRASYDTDSPILDALVDREETDVGLNVLGGATFGLGPVRPFAQGRVTLGKHLAFINEDGESGPGYAIVAGLLFDIRE